jgi:dynein heavy chain
MFSGEGEEVPFCETLYPTGNVEDWLLEVERVMRGSLKKIIEDSLINYKEVCIIVIPRLLRCIWWVWFGWSL